MNIDFALAWHSAKHPLRRSFKLPGTLELFEEYRERISKFAPASAGAMPEAAEFKKPGTKIWVCHTSKESKPLTSEKLSERLEQLQSGGTRRLFILVGGPDGFNSSQINSWHPDLLWNFGPLTLPHEIAAVVASEQIYRAWTILRGLPYHTGH